MTNPTTSPPDSQSPPPPDQAPCLARFDPVRTGTHCVYAPASRLWGAPDYDRDRTPEENLAGAVPLLCDFIDHTYADNLDGFVVELAGERFGASVRALAQTTHAVLRFLSDHDPADSRCLYGEIERVSWCFAFGGEEFFVNTFAPCYPSAHSRYGFGIDRTYLLIQPRPSFTRVLRPGETVLPPPVREKVRRDYADNGRGYDPRASYCPYEAWRIVRPLDVDAPAVRWWETPAVFP
ncbi:YqcI/YcgG family protein [Actinokineospora auranticolor]|uniref:YqcI/YcgG family protein n=1 Tax=Actinokineospora auranticolor TaxID=155976 RepID=A0A2S6GJ27_9PSEU|nr:YqcI/YcgG family protein [Actinokineospora auranticolor]PPK65219.1 YqcI/YcgG family protein [Actinokineospora auranticolor]